MKLSMSILAGMAAACMMLCGNAAKAQPTAVNFYPNGTYQFQSSGTLTFTANSTSGVTNVSVSMTATNLLTQKSSLAVYTTAKGLTLSGTATSQNVSAPLASNTLYGVTIQISDASGTITTNLT
ncbi:MAG: hypothetical protein ABSF34_22140, partial [Verrucomicrobiota bacterium]